MNPEELKRLSVKSAFEINDMSDVHRAVEDIVKVYAQFHKDQIFSYRILLPRNPESNSNSKAKKLGLVIQGELLLSLKKQKLQARIQEIRYLHDEQHYGWILISPGILAHA